MRIKRLILLLLCCTIIFTACDFGNNDNNKAIVRIKLKEDSNISREIDSAIGLPYLRDTYVKIIAIDVKTKERFEVDCGLLKTKVPSIRLTVGHEFELIVKVSSELGIWMGSRNIEVAAGDNNVAILIKKNIVGSRNVEFSITEEDGENKFSLKLPTKTLKNDDFKQYLPDFCTDNKGNLYVAGATKLHRYNSEGNYDESGLEAIDTGERVDYVATDRVTGSLYVIMGMNSGLYKINKNFESEIIADGISEDPFDVYNNFAIKIARLQDGGVSVVDMLEEDTLKKNITINNTAYIKEFLTSASENKPISTKIEIGGAIFEDIFVDDKYIYLLLGDNGGEKKASKVLQKIDEDVETGCILRLTYNITESSNGATGKQLNLSDAKFFGIGTFDTLPEEGSILPESYYSNNFYKPIKFIGFDDGKLYIADNGVQCKMRGGEVTVESNKNRIACFNTENEELSFKNAAPETTWLAEKVLWGAKSVVWSGNNFFAVEDINAIVTEEDKIAEYDSIKNTYPKDIFCYDEAGNFYLSKRDNASNQNIISKVYINHQVPKNNITSYMFSSPKELKQIAVDNIGKRIYCFIQENPAFKIKRHVWDETGFQQAEEDGDYEVELNEGEEITAMAVNKEALFVAVKIQESFDKPYTLEVRKYSHDSPILLSSVPIIENQPAKVDSEDINEFISDMQINDNQLFAISQKVLKHKTNDVPPETDIFITSGKIFNLGSTSSDSISKKVIWASTKAEDGIAPYRFVALKPKKLVIASDGAYGEKNKTNPINKNKVLIFDLQGNLQTEKDLDVEFTKKLKYDSGCGYIWE